MSNNLTNLLPAERRKALSREYVLRLSVVAVWFGTAIALISTMLLFPSYVLLSENMKAKETQLNTVESALSSTNETAFATRLNALTSSAQSLLSLASSTSASATLRAALTVPREGITLSNITFSPPKGKNAGTLTIAGSAATRDALRTYQSSLSSASFARAVNLPVSAYAKDADIPFTVTVTLSQ